MHRAFGLFRFTKNRWKGPPDPLKPWNRVFPASLTRARKQNSLTVICVAHGLLRETHWPDEAFESKFEQVRSSILNFLKGAPTSGRLYYPDSISQKQTWLGRGQHRLTSYDIDTVNIATLGKTLLALGLAISCFVFGAQLYLTWKNWRGRTWIHKFVTTMVEL